MPQLVVAYAASLTLLGDVANPFISIVLQFKLTSNMIILLITIYFDFRMSFYHQPTGIL